MRICVFLAAIVVLGEYAPLSSASVAGRESVQASELGAKWGIEVESVRLAGAEMMLDFRYRVIDPEKADLLFSRQVQPCLIHQASGVKLRVASTAKTGPLRTTYRPQAGRIYFMLFGNTRRQVSVGDRVTVMVGDFKAENLRVE
ncbi:MAG: hypothetical protein ABFD89_11980 [Bryobacteraceae bacterium]